MASYGSTFLGDLSTRLARFLRFDGSITASFNSEALPVIIVGDATQPGYGDQSLRRFAVDSGNLAASGGTDAAIYRADADLIITSLRYHARAIPAAGLDVELRLYGPLAANPVLALVGAGTFKDRAASAFDRPPLRAVHGAEAPIAGGALIGYGQASFTAAVQAGDLTSCELIPAPFCLQAGGMLWVTTNQQLARRVVLHGYTT